jgi:hypothetical protein
MQMPRHQISIETAFQPSHMNGDLLMEGFLWRENLVSHQHLKLMNLCNGFGIRWLNHGLKYEGGHCQCIEGGQLGTGFGRRRRMTWKGNGLDSISYAVRQARFTGQKSHLMGVPGYAGLKNVEELVSGSGWLTKMLGKR